MPKLTIDGMDFDAPEGWTILETARYLGLEIPSLCFNEGLSPWGGCRLCMVEITKQKRSKLVTSCTYPVEEQLHVRTNAEKVIHVRKIILELLIAQCPTSKVLQDLASRMGLNMVRFSPRWENCIQCGLCVRMCNEQMMAEALGFSGRGRSIRIATPFHENSEVCRKCGGCIYVCPACTLRCDGAQPETVLCGGCSHLQPETGIES
jgi:coenzyme F420 hydrogenase subunit beta